MTKLTFVRDLLKKLRLDALLLSSESDIRYLTSYGGFSQKERDAFLLVTKTNAHLFTSSLYKDEVAHLHDEIQIHEFSRKNSLTHLLTSICTDESLKKIGFDETDITVAEFEKLSSIPHVLFLPTEFWSLRINKTSEEIDLIKKACEITDLSYEFILKHCNPGISEIELARTLEFFIKKQGADLSFPTIAAFGKNAAIPHHHTNHTKLKKNDAILIDFGVRYQNYCSDMTRTFFIGTPSPEQKKIYQTVKNAQDAAAVFIQKKLETGAELRASEIDEVARQTIIGNGYPPFPHSLGHGIGIDVHEAPALSPLSTDTLTEGMVFSLEPGIYLPHTIGVRIEDLFAIQDNHLIRLTNSNTSLIQI